MLLLHNKRKYLEFTDVVEFKDVAIREITNSYFWWIQVLVEEQ